MQIPWSESLGIASLVDIDKILKINAAKSDTALEIGKFYLLIQKSLQIDRLLAFVTNYEHITCP